MDAGRFGRVLGVGARMAAKTVVSAVDAANAPNPNAGARPAGEAQVRSGGKAQVRSGASGAASDPATRAAAISAEVPRAPDGAARTRGAEAAARVERARAQVGQTGRGLRQGGRRFGEAVWGPVVKLSGVLWLELTGVFFGLFAVSAAAGAWRLREAWRGVGQGVAEHEAHSHFLVAVGIAVLFGYFCITSFARAHRRGRGR